MLIGAVYFLPQALHLQHARNSNILLEENYDEMAYAVWASRAAGEHPGQPDPYQLIAGSEQPASFATAQPLPAFLLGTCARLLRWRVTTVFLVGSFLFPAIVGFLFLLLAWCCGLREPWQLALSATFSLLVLSPVLWLMQWRYVTSLMADAYPGFRLTLPYSRRSQPQLTAIFHYAAITFSLLATNLKTGLQRWLSGLLAGIAFGLSFYCYYFSWTLLLGWFVLGGFFIWRLHKGALKVWLACFAIGCIIALPYLWFLARHFNDISGSAASARTHAIPQDPAIAVTLLMCATLAGALWLERKRRLLFWPLLVLNLVAVLGALQNVITGIYAQPYHYLHYFARPTTNLSLVMLIAWALQRWLNNGKSLRAIGVAEIALVILMLSIAVVFQWTRYREVSSLAQAAMTAQSALAALNREAAPGAVVFCPQATVREAIPLYTNAVSFFSLYMSLNENDNTRQTFYERIAGMQWLNGMSDEAFSNWLRSRPLEVYFQQMQRRIDAQGEEQMRERAEKLGLSFATLRPESFASLRYALLPTEIQLETTRLPFIFQIRKLWADEQYALFALTLK
jgi:hypothetical protein